MITTNPELEDVSYEEAKSKGSLFLAKWRDFQRERDYEIAAMAGIFGKWKPCRILTPRKAAVWYRKLGHDKVYRDYAPQQSAIYDRLITSFYTSFGISNIDSWFARQIQQGDVKKNFKLLKKAILTNPHLHPVIRNNLYQNLVTYHEKSFC